MDQGIGYAFFAFTKNYIYKEIMYELLLNFYDGRILFHQVLILKQQQQKCGHPESKLYRSCQNFVRQIWRALMQFSKAFDEES